MAVTIDAEGIRKLFPEIDQIQNPALRQGVLEIWLEVAAATAWSRFEDIPKNLKAEKYRPLVPHIRGVARMALAMADVASELHGTAFDRDLLLAACLLHDASKPLEFEPDPEGEPGGEAVLAGRKSAVGKNIQHGVFTAHKVLEKGLPLELANLIITHTHSSGVRPHNFEGALVFYADFADSDAGIAPTGSKLYAQRWSLR